MTNSMITSPLIPFLQGFLLCASSIIAIGPQNLFILRQGMRRQHLFATAFFSTLADVILISFGVGGLSALISANSVIQTVVTICGVIFLLYCGVKSLLRAYHRGSQVEQITSHSVASTGVQTTIIAALCFSFLNPSAYLDTLMIIGSKSLTFSMDQRLAFGIGAMLASTFWFFTLVYGASRLSPMLRSQMAWRALDVVSGFIMLGVATTMLTATAITV